MQITLYFVYFKNQQKYLSKKLMKKLLVIIGAAIVITFAIIGCSIPKDRDVEAGINTNNEQIEKAFEKVYFDAQVDFAQGEIKIQDVNGYYQWLKSPREDGKIPIYKPENYIIAKNGFFKITGEEVYAPKSKIKEFIENAINKQQPGNKDSVKIKYKISPGKDFDTIIIPKNK